MKIFCSAFKFISGRGWGKVLFTAVFIYNSYLRGLYVDVNKTLYFLKSVPEAFFKKSTNEISFAAIFMLISIPTFGYYFFACY